MLHFRFAATRVVSIFNLKSCLGPLPQGELHQVANGWYKNLGFCWDRRLASFSVRFRQKRHKRWSYYYCCRRYFQVEMTKTNFNLKDPSGILCWQMLEKHMHWSRYYSS